MKPFLIGIAGGTGSGKSTFARLVAKKFRRQVLVLSQDMYYKDQSGQPLPERKKANMDCPDALDNNLLFEHLQKLQNNRDIDAPVYNFANHTRLRTVKHLKPKKVIILEGLLALAVKKLRNLFDLKIYVEVDSDLRLARRILRDVREGREKSSTGSIKQYLSSAYPMHRRYVEPQRKYADLIVPWDNMGYEAMETVVARIEGELQERE